MQAETYLGGKLRAQMIWNQKLLSSKNAKYFREKLSWYLNFQTSSGCLLVCPGFCMFAANEKYTISLFQNN